MESKHTKGEWKWVGNRLRNDENKIVFTEPQFTTPQSVELARANRQIIAEAGTVTNETGLTPRELQQSHYELQLIAERLIMLFENSISETTPTATERQMLIRDIQISTQICKEQLQAIKNATK